MRWLYHHLQHDGFCVRPPWAAITQMNIRAVLKRWIPRGLRHWVRRVRHGVLYEGDFTSWSDAQRVSQGYGDPAITQRVLAAARAVRDDQASWDRDTVLFREPAANVPLVRAMRHAAIANGGRLNVVDVGGALGSTWWQNRTWLADLTEVRWSVLEQSALVAAGRREFVRGPVRFYDSLAECCANESPTVVLLSGVLGYLEQPHRLLEEIRTSGFRHIIIDRTGFVERGRDLLTVQRVPPVIYPGSYPCWFLDRAKFLLPFRTEWTIIDEWTTEDDIDIDAQHRGILMERKPGEVV